MKIPALLAVAALLLAGCSADPPPAPPAPTSTPPLPATRSITLANGSTCAVTLGGKWNPPPGVSASSLFGADSSYGNGTLWVGSLWDDGTIEAGGDFIEPDGSVRMKFGWWRGADGRLTITGRRLDGTAPPLVADIPDGYGTRGFQATGLLFPTEGCWEVTGDLAGSKLVFVTLVKKISP